MEHLLSPLRIGAISSRNRIAMAPCTRCMSPEFTPTEDVAAYYERRAADGVGLLISEGTVICERANGYLGAPGIFRDEHVAAWRKVTDRVHSAGGAIVCQIWHVGSVAHPLTTGGVLPEGPSGVSPEGPISRLRHPDGRPVEYGETEAMNEARILEVIDLFRQAAGRAVDAGFDGVEIHGAHSYLIDQFVNLHWNRRDDDWGGEQRTRFAYEVARAVIAEIGADRVLYRFSPRMSVASVPWQRPAETLPLLLRTLADAGVRSVHASNLDYDEAFLPIDCLPTDRRTGLQGDNVSLAAATRRLWDGLLIGVGGLTPARAERAIADGEIDMAAFGRSLIANADFVSRVREGQELVTYDPEMLVNLV